MSAPGRQHLLEYRVLRGGPGAIGINRDTPMSIVLRHLFPEAEATDAPPMPMQWYLDQLGDA